MEEYSEMLNSSSKPEWTPSAVNSPGIIDALVGW